MPLEEGPDPPRERPPYTSGETSFQGHAGTLQGPDPLTSCRALPLHKPPENSACSIPAAHFRSQAGRLRIVGTVEAPDARMEQHRRPLRAGIPRGAP